MDPGSGLGEPASSPRPYSADPDDLRARREPHRRHRGTARHHRHVPRAQRVRLAGAVDHFRGGTCLHRLGLRRRRHLGNQPRHQQRAMGDRGARADPQGSAQYLLRPVEADARAARSLGRRNRRAHRLIRLAGHRLHTQSPSRDQLSGHCRVGELLSVHRVRTASGRRAGTRGRPSAAPVRTGHHGPHAHGVGAGVRCASARYPAGRHHHAFAAERVPHSVHRRGDDPRALRLGVRLHPDVDPVLAHGDSRAGGTCGAAPGRTG